MVNDDVLSISSLSFSEDVGVSSQELQTARFAGGLTCPHPQKDAATTTCVSSNFSS